MLHITVAVIWMEDCVPLPSEDRRRDQNKGTQETIGRGMFGSECRRRKGSNEKEGRIESI
jgi:hypothetical protein